MLETKDLHYEQEIAIFNDNISIILILGLLEKTPLNGRDLFRGNCVLEDSKFKYSSCPTDK